MFQHPPSPPRCWIFLGLKQELINNCRWSIQTFPIKKKNKSSSNYKSQKATKHIQYLRGITHNYHLDTWNIFVSRHYSVFQIERFLSFNKIIFSWVAHLASTLAALSSIDMPIILLSSGNLKSISPRNGNAEQKNASCQFLLVHMDVSSKKWTCLKPTNSQHQDCYRGHVGHESQNLSMSFRINDKSGEQHEKYGTPSRGVNVALQSFPAVLHSSGFVLRCWSLKRTMGAIQNTGTPNAPNGRKNRCSCWLTSIWEHPGSPRNLPY